MTDNQSTLPFGDAFSPGQLHTDATESSELVVILELIAEHEGNEDKFKSAVAERFFQETQDSEERARLVVLGLKDPGYQLVTDDFTFTTLGSRLYELRSDESELYDAFARHILLNLHGRKVIEVILDLDASGEKTTAENIKDALERRYGITVSETSNHWSQMRGWLNKAGILNTGSHHYNIDTERLNEVLDLSSQELETLEDFTTEQRAFLRGLAAIDPGGPIKNTKVREIASNRHDAEIPQSKITENILEPLADAGYIEISTRRGAPNLVEPTADFEAEVLSPLLRQLAERIDVPREALQLNFAELDNAIGVQSSSKRRTALTALGVRLGRQLGLEYVGRRTEDTGAGEVSADIIMDDTTFTLTRWLVHCSASRSQVTPTQIASTTTTARLTNANTILYVARGGFREDANRMATRIMKNEPYTILTLTNQPNPAYDDDPNELFDDLAEQLSTIRRTKALPEDGPFRGVSVCQFTEDDSIQRTVAEFEDGFGQFKENESESRGLDEFTD
ncbi:restriction endonuclease [Haloarchaeobius sp. FL176]|uniref:restriction endonuclease n=1 Tax=Haloarchaeobius sp. FL176 TaxID=2967129 RepID=UPI0021497B00|nr:restriction endonuclease [Haloarchaeobius sp. FL176]